MDGGLAIEDTATVLMMMMTGSVTMDVGMGTVAKTPTADAVVASSVFGLLRLLQLLLLLRL